MMINDDLQAAVEALRQGKVILYPTDTVWGIGCDATDGEAVGRIYDLKRRSDSKAMILLVDSTEMLKAHVESLPARAEEIINSSDRPVTVVVGGAKGVAPALLAADGSAGFRVSRDEFSASLCRELGRPVVSTSANISGEPTAASFSDISDDIKDGVDYVCFTRRDDRTPGRPSRVIKINDDNTITVLRD